MKCNKCLFSKEIDSEIIECCNVIADDYGYRLFAEWDGCNDGKASTVGLNDAEKFSILTMYSDDK